MATKKRPVTRKKTTHHRSKASEMKSFKVVADTVPFTSFRLTRQTFYWVLILAFIVIMQLWIIKLQTDVANLTDSLTILQQTGL